jgi:hypothetical protein
MNANLKPSDQITLLDYITPQSATTVQGTGWIDMSLYDALLVTTLAGVLAGGATLDAKIQQATSAAGAGAKDVTGRAITQQTGSGKAAVINLFSSNLDVQNGFRYVKVTMTPATAAALIACTVQGVNARYQPGTATANLVEVVG